MLGRGGCGPGGCDKRCDRYAARPKRRFDCRVGQKDPRIPGPRIISTLPRQQPEMTTPTFLYPVPTYPVFGPRSEEPDGIEPQLQPLMPEDAEQIESEPLPMPNESAAPDDEEEYDDLTDGGSSALQLAAPKQTVEQAGWKPAKTRGTEASRVSRPCAKCGVTFRSSNPIRQ
ncbi:MAG TPA: hypothetical protein PK867_14680 [Pirellulales bacterium]|nr:hypothetical protein [Pirellulales bacterium]